MIRVSEPLFNVRRRYGVLFGDHPAEDALEEMLESSYYTGIRYKNQDFTLPSYFSHV